MAMEMKAQHFDHQFQVILMGNSGVGKSSIVKYFANNQKCSKNNPHNPTLGIEFQSKVVKVHGKRVSLRFLDTAGDPRFRTHTPSFLEQADAVVLVYSVEDHKSFDDLAIYRSEVDKYLLQHGKDPATLLFGNKCDLTDKQIVPFSAASGLAQRLDIEFYETSAVSGDNIDKAFNDLAQRLLESLPSAHPSDPMGSPPLIKYSGGKKKTGFKNKQCTRMGRCLKKTFCCCCGKQITDDDDPYC